MSRGFWGEGEKVTAKKKMLEQQGKEMQAEGRAA